jgi:hypothetical protein
MAIAIAGLAVGLASSTAGNTALAAKLWTAGTSPLLLASMTRKVLAGRLGVGAPSDGDHRFRLMTSRRTD